MVFKKMKPNRKPGEDCSDFKPKLFKRNHCKLFDRCAKGTAGKAFIERTALDGYCDGIRRTLW